MSGRYDYGVFCGRFQPLHAGHAFVIERALTSVDCLIVLIGSANVAPDSRNPFTYDERRAHFEAAFAAEIASGHLIVAPVDDHLYSDAAWCAEVQRRVADIVEADGSEPSAARVALTGYGKDASSYYLKLFPEWESLQVESAYGTFSSTDIRKRYFQRLPDVPAAILPAPVAAWLDTYKLSDGFRARVEEAEYLEAYPKQYGKGPFITADAVVIQSGHILLIRRARIPGKGLLALPGGFVDLDEPIRDAAIRELKEETQLSDGKGELPPAMLASFIDDARTRVFDAPNRSTRGRVVTHAFLFRLPERRKLFQPKASDDASDARWYRLGDLKPNDFFEDHWAILNLMADL